MEENFNVSSKSVWIVEDGIHKRIIYGKVKPKLIALFSRLSWSLPFHITLNRKVEPVNCGYAEQAFQTSKIKELH